HHFGSRIVFDNKGYLYFSIGDRGKRENAQDLTLPNGKIHRIFKDGRIPEDNPFFTSDENFYKTIYAYGNRNPQGLAFNPETGELWESEHGQKGGDELNIIKSGNNYGWDKITYGRNYDGTVSTKKVKMPGMEIPILFWRPSIAVCGIDFYKGDLFPNWKNHLIVGALKFEEVRLLDIEDNRVIHQETIIEKSGRVRDVCSAPDGSIYIVTNQPDKILRLTPQK
ncbi:MAG: PQQ-dependent sugar dehydrogenase, partial [Ignavibacteriae bacterium]|nr:PQQ-dependent sugar dehydrogenase [Ignavibacteriota bacterium]